jgi:hypothetical protein
MENKYTFDTIIQLNEPKSNIEFCEIKNFKTNNIKNKKHFHGTYFASRYRLDYAAMLHEYIGGYLQLKKIYPDLKLVFFKYDESENNKNSVRNELPVLDFIKYFNAEVINIDQEEFLFDKIIFHNSEVPVFPELNSITGYKIMDEFCNEIKTWRINSMKVLVDEFYVTINKNKIKNNIYITRSLINKFWMKSNNEYILNKRLQKEAYDENLDVVLSNSGYDVIEFFNYGFFEQMNLTYNSNIYLAIDGSTFSNAIWCSPETKIVKIIVNKEYGYYWEDILKSVDRKFFKIIDVSNLNPEDGIELIKKEIKDLG